MQFKFQYRISAHRFPLFIAITCALGMIACISSQPPSLSSGLPSGHTEASPFDDPLRPGTIVVVTKQGFVIVANNSWLTTLYGKEDVSRSLPTPTPDSEGLVPQMSSETNTVSLSASAQAKLSKRLEASAEYNELASAAVFIGMNTVLRGTTKDVEASFTAFRRTSAFSAFKKELLDGMEANTEPLLITETNLVTLGNYTLKFNGDVSALLRQSIIKQSGTPTSVPPAVLAGGSTTTSPAPALPPKTSTAETSGASLTAKWVFKDNEASRIASLENQAPFPRSFKLVSLKDKLSSIEK